MSAGLIFSTTMFYFRIKKNSQIGSLSFNLDVTVKPPDVGQPYRICSNYMIVQSVFHFWKTWNNPILQRERNCHLNQISVDSGSICNKDCLQTHKMQFSWKATRSNVLNRDYKSSEFKRAAETFTHEVF